MQLTKSIIWAIHDKEKFASLIADLTKLVGDLKEFTKDNASSGSSGVLARGRWRALKHRITTKLSRKSRLRLKGRSRSQLLLGGMDSLGSRSTVASESRFSLVPQREELWR